MATLPVIEDGTRIPLIDEIFKVLESPDHNVVVLAKRSYFFSLIK
jgi:hypothetical protein